jgi:hypothetical protein
VDLRKLLQKVESARVGSPELDNEFVSTFRSAPPNVTRSIDAAIRLIQAELPGWWWNCGSCEHKNGASLYVPGSSRIRGNVPGMNGSRPEDLLYCLKTRSGARFSTAASIAIAEARFRLRCWLFSLRPRSP